MRAELKKWGNGLAVRVPRNHPIYGRLEEGTPVEFELRPVRKEPATPPLTFSLPIPDLSTRHDEFRAGAMDEELERWRSSTRVS